MQNTSRLIVVSVLYLLLFILCYPLYQYLFDADGIGYMMVAKRLAWGDYASAINGCWSPLHSWLIAPFYKWGIDVFTAFKVSNGIIGLGILVWISRLLNKTQLGDGLKSIALLTCIPILLSYVYHDLAADIIFCFLILVYIDIVTGKDFFQNRNKNIACGIIGCLCYFAKTYGFVFFPLSFLLVQTILYRASNLPNRKALLTRNLLWAIPVFLLLASPWIYILSNKYGFLTFGYSGQLNLKWALLDRLEYEGSLLKAPHYPNSPANWEDPLYYPYRFKEASFFTLLIREIRLVFTNFMTAIELLTAFSFFSMAIITGLSVYLVKKRDTLYTLFFLFIVLMPAGYLAINVQSRYIYPINFLLLIGGIFLLQKAFEVIQPGKYASRFYWGLFFASFLIYPINWLKDVAGRDKDLFVLAKEWKAKGIQGKYATTANGNHILLERAAYINDSQLYMPTKEAHDYQELHNALKEHGIDYFFFFYRYRTDLDAFMQTTLYKSATVVSGNTGIVILKMQ
jgi:hypothetical protein